MNTFRQFIENDEDYTQSDSYKRFKAMMDRGSGQQQPAATPQPAPPSPEDRLAQFHRMAATPTKNPLLTGMADPVQAAAPTKLPSGLVPSDVLATLPDSEIAPSLSVAMIKAGKGQGAYKYYRSKKDGQVYYYKPA